MERDYCGILMPRTPHPSPHLADSLLLRAGPPRWERWPGTRTASATSPSTPAASTLAPPRVPPPHKHVYPQPDPPGVLKRSLMPTLRRISPLQSGSPIFNSHLGQSGAIYLFLWPHLPHSLNARERLPITPPTPLGMTRHGGYGTCQHSCACCSGGTNLPILFRL